MVDRDPARHAASRPEQVDRQFEGYDPEDQRPLAAYTAITVVYATVAGAAWSALSATGKEPRRPSLQDSFRLGVATHKLARLVAKDKVTSPYRAPFSRFEGADRAAPAEVSESPRGRGLRYALGELVGCPYCLAPWIATALLAGQAVAPRPTEGLLALMEIVTVSDWMQILYKGSESKLL